MKQNEQNGPNVEGFSEYSGGQAACDWFWSVPTHRFDVQFDTLQSVNNIDLFNGVRDGNHILLQCQGNALKLSITPNQNGEQLQLANNGWSSCYIEVYFYDYIKRNLLLLKHQWKKYRVEDGKYVWGTLEAQNRSIWQSCYYDEKFAYLWSNISNDNPNHSQHLKIETMVWIRP